MKEENKDEVFSCGTLQAEDRRTEHIDRRNKGKRKNNVNKSGNQHTQEAAIKELFCRSLLRNQRHMLN